MNKDEQGYNGWTNYETWAVNLWLTNDEGSQDEVIRLTQEAVINGEVHPAHNLADSLRCWVEDEAPDMGASLYADLLGAAMSSVNWDELAAHYLEDYNE